MTVFGFCLIKAKQKNEENDKPTIHGGKETKCIQGAFSKKPTTHIAYGIKRFPDHPININNLRTSIASKQTGDQVSTFKTCVESYLLAKIPRKTLNMVMAISEVYPADVFLLVFKRGK